MTFDQNVIARRNTTNSLDPEWETLLKVPKEGPTGNYASVVISQL